MWNHMAGPPNPLYESIPTDTPSFTEGKYVDWTVRYYACRTNRLDKVEVDKIQIII